MIEPICEVSPPLRRSNVDPIPKPIELKVQPKLSREATSAILQIAGNPKHEIRKKKPIKKLKIKIIVLSPIWKIRCFKHSKLFKISDLQIQIFPDL